MKTNSRYFVVIFLMLMAIILILAGQTEKINNLEILLQKRTTLDSLYGEHLKQCSMISKDDVGIDGNGYFYYKYHQ